MIQRHLKLIFVCILVAGMIGCGKDSATGPDPGEAPSLPDLEKAEPDVAYFENNNPKQTSGSRLATTENFYAAKGLVMGGSSFFAVGQIYGSFFNQTSTADAEYKDGVWEWTFTASYGGMTAEYKTTAEKLSNGSVKWALYWSFDDGETSIENYKMMEGTVSSDGSKGDWTFNSLDTENNQEVPAITSSWTVTSDTEKDLTMEVFNSSGSLNATIDYEQNGPEYVMTLSYVDQPNVVIAWNTDTGTGSITEGENERCWDSNFQDISCS